MPMTRASALNSITISIFLHFFRWPAQFLSIRTISVCQASGGPMGMGGGGGMWGPREWGHPQLWTGPWGMGVEQRGET